MQASGALIFCEVVLSAGSTQEHAGIGQQFVGNGPGVYFERAVGDGLAHGLHLGGVHIAGGFRSFAQLALLFGDRHRHPRLGGAATGLHRFGSGTHLFLLGILGSGLLELACQHFDVVVGSDLHFLSP